MLDFFAITYWAHTFSPVIGFIAYFYVVENVPRRNHLTFIYLFLSFFADVLTYMQFVPAQIVFNLHDIAQFVVIMVIYIALFKNRGALFLATVILIYLAGIISTITIIGLTTFHTHMSALSGFMISIMCLVYVNAVNVWPKELAADKDLYSILTLNTAFLFYFMATFVFYLISDIILEELPPEKVRNTWAYHNIIGIIKNFGLAAAIFLTGKARVSETSEKPFEY